MLQKPISDYTKTELKNLRDLLLELSADRRNAQVAAPMIAAIERTLADRTEHRTPRKEPTSTEKADLRAKKETMAVLKAEMKRLKAALDRMTRT